MPSVCVLTSCHLTSVYHLLNGWLRTKWRLGLLYLCLLPITFSPPDWDSTVLPDLCTPLCICLCLPCLSVSSWEQPSMLLMSGSILPTTCLICPLCTIQSTLSLTNMTTSSSISPCKFQMCRSKVPLFSFIWVLYKVLEFNNYKMNSSFCTQNLFLTPCSKFSELTLQLLSPTFPSSTS